MGEFSLNAFLTRFLCDDPALKECRHVCRMQLGLSILGIDTGDSHAQLLHTTINYYQSAKEVITVNDIITLIFFARPINDFT